MENEIPAGTKVTVNGQEGEVLAHMDGVVHVSVAGEAISVLPEQIEPIDVAAPAAQAQPSDDKSTASPASAEPAGEAPASGPEATAGATGQ